MELEHLINIDLQTTTAEKVQVLLSVSNILTQHTAPNFQQSNVLFVCIQVLEELKGRDYPEWMSTLLYRLAKRKTDLPSDQLLNLAKVVRDFVVVYNSRQAITSLRPILGGYPFLRESFIGDEELFETLKCSVELPGTLNCIQNLALNANWKLRLLSDQPFILSLLKQTENPTVWDLFITIAQHPDAKTLMPPEVLETASKVTLDRTIDLCALLCSDSDLKGIKLTPEWIVNHTSLLHTLLTRGKVTHNSINYNLMDLLVPLTNLSTIDELKAEIGKLAIPLLLDVVLGNHTRDVSMAYLYQHLEEGRQEASRALWNLAYLESNRTLITMLNGILGLAKVMDVTEDPILKQNIEGVLHMFKTPAQPTVVDTANKKHVMISYNWDDQPIVIQIADAIKEHGYSVWLDIEKMAGSILGTMAQAIENAEIVVMCISQKYKDSPNCRLEGEYCISRKLPFVPLMMQHGYKPDGWLGIALGTKLWHDFTNNINWKFKVTALIKAIGEHSKATSASQVVIPAQSNKDISLWTGADVHKWMKAAQIASHYELFKKHKIDGKALAELKRIHSLHKYSFFNQVCLEMGISAIGDRLALSAALFAL